MLLEIKNLNKSFADHHVLQDISLTITSGKAMGFLGRNGAGKTTTIRCLMDVFKADSGEILLDGKPFSPTQFRVGYLPEERGLYSKEKILHQLIYFATLRGAEQKAAKASAEYWLERFGLTYAKNHKLETLSKGNQQKVQIAQALLNDPEIIILDEPFSGLDPINSQVLKDVIKESIAAGKLLIFSSHQMNYVEEFCDEITLIEKGKIILRGSLKEIKRELGQKRLRLVSNNLTQSDLEIHLNERINDIVVTQDTHSLIIELLNNKSKAQLLKELIENNIEIDSFSNYEPSLYDIFVKEVGEEHA